MNEKIRLKAGAQILFGLIISLFLYEPAYAQKFDYNGIMERISNDQRTGIKYVGTMDEWISSQKEDGSWDAVTYGKLSVSVGTGQVGDHVGMLWHLAAAATEPSHSRYGNENYKKAVKAGLQFWYGSNTVDPNWWYNQIDFPQKLGEILIFMRVFKDYIPAVSEEGIDEQKIISLFYPREIKDITLWSTGANAIDISQHYIYRGLLTKDSVLLVQTRNRLEEVLVDNIRNDLVYHDHGPQIQISSYGKVFCNGLLRLASYLAGSPAAFDVNSENFGKVIGFIRETQLSSIRGSSWDFSVMGREISRSNALNASLSYLKTLIDFKIDSTNNSVYQDALDRMSGAKSPDYNVREFNKHYWASDYSQHARKGYLFAVRNVSTRTVEAETGNNENLKANYFSYGATFISVDGTEYKNIMPYWDWSMIPGSTFPHTAVFPTRPNWGGNYGKTSFVGGVSDGIHGVAVLDQDKETTKAKKSWFFFENEIICLGAGISDNSGLEVRTTINQAKMTNPSYSSETGSDTEKVESLNSSVYSNSKLKYIRNGKIGYFFPAEGNIKYTMKQQSGRWRDINGNGSSSTVSGNVFSLWVDHGINPQNSTYSYIVVPGIDSKAKAQDYDLSEIEILENSTGVQAVCHSALDIIQAVFYQADTLTRGNRTITVDSPCVLMLKNGSVVSVSDPSQTKSAVNVTVKIDDTEYKKNIPLPTGTGMRGATATVDFEIPTGTSFINTGNEPGISFAPNPTEGWVTLSASQSGLLNFVVRNSKGQSIISNRFKKKTNINLSAYPAGIYFLTVYDKSIIYTEKIIKF